MNSCKNCQNAIFDQKYGEYKCAIRKHRIYDISKYLNCKDHKPVKGGVSG